MQTRVEKSDGVAVVVIEGRVDGTTASDLGQVLHDVVAAGDSRLVLDLEAVEYVGSAGLREFVTALKKATQQDGDLRLASPNERVTAILELSGLSSILAIHSTRGDAVGSF
jgi:anti-anti-sigma factor